MQTNRRGKLLHSRHTQEQESTRNTGTQENILEQ